MDILNKKITFILSLLFAFAISGCVGDKKPTTNAQCESGFQFDPVSRSCFAAGSTPVGTLTQVNVVENSGMNSVTLTYRDGNRDLATSCQVMNDSDSRIELSSPRIYEHVSRSSALLSSIQTVYGVIAPLGLLDRDIAVNSVTNIRRSSTLSVSLSARDSLINAARNLASTAIATGSAVAVTSGQALESLVDDYQEYFQELANRCVCEAGVCRTTLVPRLNQSGNAGFRYTVTEPADGVSNTQNVAVNVSAVAKRPIPVHGDFSILESATSTPLVQTFTPLDALSANSLSYFVVNTVNNGMLSGCFSPFNFPNLCSYLPDDGDTSDEWQTSGVQRAFPVEGEFATVDFQNIRYTATFKGSAGNNIRVRYVAYQGLGFPPEGTVRILSDSNGPIIEVTVVNNVTMTDAIESVINDALNDADHFVEALALTGPVIIVTGETTLAGGEDAQDTFTYRVCDGMLCSDFDGAYSIRIEEVDDPPSIDTANISSVPDPILEDTVFDLTLTYFDPDDAQVATVCAITPVVALDFITNTCACVAGVCTANLQTAQDFNGATAIQVELTNAGLTTPLTTVNMSVLGINDAPIARDNSFLFPAYTFVDDSIFEHDGVTINATNIYTSDELILDRGDLTTRQTEENQTLTMEILITNQDDTAQSVIPMTSEFIQISFAGNDITPVNTDPLTPMLVTIPTGMGVTRFTLTPDRFQSTPPPGLKVTVTLRDNGGVLNGGVDQSVSIFNLEVINVDFPPTIAPIANVETNEGGEVYSPPIIITEGGLSDEAAQTISIVSITTDNPALLPASNITLHYNNVSQSGLPNQNELIGTGEGPFPIALGDGADASADAALFLRLRPVGAVTGTSNITIRVSDGLNEVESTFALIVYPISAKHGGWNLIRSVSNKVFSASQLDPNRVCFPHTDKCSGGNCQGTAAPNSSISADEAFTIFFDNANQRCYHSTGVGVANWLELNTFCPITLSSENANCVAGASCMGTAAPAIAPTAKDQYFFDYSNRVCYRSEGTDVADWTPYFPSKVSLGWNDFVLAGSGADTGVLISGWEVYRRTFETPFDFETPVAVLPASARSFEDATVNEKNLYYYLVRPVDGKRGIATATTDVFSEIRVFTPPRNMSFVHRWMVNQEICSQMGKTIQNELVDPQENFRCEFAGPGATDVAGTFYYDIGRDLFVDIAEAGCPFSTNATAISTCGPNGCVGVGAPAFAAPPNNLIYYDRSTGSCHRSSGGIWDVVEATGLNATLANATQSVLLPPLVNVTQSRASAICSSRSSVSVASVDGVSTAPAYSLPSRLEQIAYSAQPLNLSDIAIEQIERGLSLNTSSKCNSTRASGVADGYTSGQIPPSSFYYSLPGTSTSGIRSVATGSVVMGNFQSTQSCESRYGIQDVYGNVSEWVQERMSCAGNECIGTTANFSLVGMSGVYPEAEYRFDGIIGPCRDIDADGVCDPSLTSWLIQDKNFSANFLSFPMGLPIHRDFVFDFPTDSISINSLEIGPTSGITNAKLKRDAFIINASGVENAAPNNGSFAVGGGYTSGDAAGRFTFELIPNVAVAGIAASGGDIVSSSDGAHEMSFVAAQVGAAGNLISVGIIESGSVASVQVSVSGSSVVVTVPTGGATGTDIQTAIGVSASSLIGSVNFNVGGAAASTYSASTGSFLAGGLDPVNPFRNDVGFRCMAPIVPAAYDLDAEFTY